MQKPRPATRLPRNAADRVLTGAGAVVARAITATESARVAPNISIERSGPKPSVFHVGYNLTNAVSLRFFKIIERRQLKIVPAGVRPYSIFGGACRFFEHLHMATIF